MKKHRHHHRHRHFEPRGVGVTYGVSAYGLGNFGYGGGWTAQDGGGHDCLSGQQFPADSCPAADGAADAGGANSGTGDAGTGGSTT